jgi:hypothetical protein
LYRRKRISTNAFSEYELINKELVLENSYVDYKVSLDTTYEYVYTVVRGGLGNESDSSYTVSGKPLASKLGDSNGDSSVSVLDVVTAVNYIMERDPAPFIYRQTDMNNDAGINVLDIVGIIDRILNPRAGSVVSDYDYNSLLFAGEVSLYRVGDTVFGRSSQPIAGIETRESEVQEWVGEVNRWERIGKPGKDAGSMVFGFNNNLDASVDKAIAVIQKKSDPARWLFSAPSGQPLKVNWMGTPAVNRDRISNELSLSGVYPNPTDGHCRLTIEVHGLQVDNIVVRVIDATGRNVYVLPLGSRSKGLYQQDLNLGKLPKGSYVIQTSWSMGEQSHMRNEKIVVQ